MAAMAHPVMGNCYTYILITNFIAVPFVQMKASPVVVLSSIFIAEIYQKKLKFINSIIMCRWS